MLKSESNLEFIYKLSLSGNGSPLVNIHTLLEFSAYAKCRGGLIYILEAFRLDNDLQIPCIELGIYAGELSERAKNIDWVEKIELHREKVNSIVEDLKGDPFDYAFNVWVIESEADYSD